MTATVSRTAGDVVTAHVPDAAHPALAGRSMRALPSYVLFPKS